MSASFSTRAVHPGASLNDIAALPSDAAVKPLEDRANRTDRFGLRLLNLVKAWFGTPSQRRLAQGALQIDQIRHWENEFSKLTDQEILQRGQQLRGRARGGEALDSML